MHGTALLSQLLETGHAPARAVLVALVSFLGLVVLGALACARLLKRGAVEVHKRGALLRDGSRLRWRTPPRSHAPPRWPVPRRVPGFGRLTLAGEPIEFLDETKHFKMIGTTGSGKSTAIRELLGAALARGDRAVFADPDGGYRDRFWNRYRGDIVLNPFERESVRWDPFAEIRDPYDVEALATGLIATSDDSVSNEWRGYARTFVAALLRRCHRDRHTSCAELWRLAAVAPVVELRALLADTPAQAFLDADNARMFGSIRAVATSALAALDLIREQRAAPFSVREWVRRRARPGALFIPYQAGQIAALRSLIAAWMRMAIFEAMNTREGGDQRLWFVIDELDALGAVEGLKDALARLRKFGGRCVLGFQSIAQVSGTYGMADAQTLVENCGNTLILRCAGSENGGTSQFASKLIGDREVIRRQTSRGRDRDGAFAARGGRRSTNTSEQHVMEVAVMPSQIEQLPDLCGYLKSASSPAWRRVSLR